MSSAWLEALAATVDDPPELALLPVAHPDHEPPLGVSGGLPFRKMTLAGEEVMDVGERVEVLVEGEVPRLLLSPPAVPLRAGHVRYRPVAGPELPGPLVGEGAVVAAVVEAAEESGALVLVTQRLLTAPEGAVLRGWLAGRGLLRWVLFLGRSAAEALGTPGHRMAVLVTGPAEEGADIPLVRLADLRELPVEEWRPVLEKARNRKGGEVHSSIVLRDVPLDTEAWTYERFSQSYREAREDARALGDVVPLGELAEVLEGIGPKELTGLVRGSRRGDVEPTVACYGASSLGADGELGRPTHLLADPDVPEGARLREGDVLVPSRVGSIGDWTAARLRKERLPATFEGASLLAVRFRDGVEPSIRDLVASFLASPRAAEWLRAHGGTGSLRGGLLARLEVASPGEEVLEALEGLAEAERIYLEWAREAREAREGLFAEASFAGGVPALLERQRLERERVRAGRDSRSPDYAIRNYYPHPIAYRREQLLRLSPGEDLVKEILYCAEITVNLVGLLGIAQLGSLGEHRAGTLPGVLAHYVQGDELHLDWGRMHSLVAHCVALSRRHGNPLSLPVPELATVPLPDDAPEGSWWSAEAELRQRRNRLAHLYQPSPGELESLCPQLREHLDVLLEGVAFLGGVRLVMVEDCSRDALTGVRRARLRVLQGVSPVFKREEREVDRELATHSVALLDAQERLHDLHPWLVATRCPKCQRDELFMFNRVAEGTATYVALESGHHLSSKPLGTVWSRVVEGAGGAGN